MEGSGFNPGGSSIFTEGAVHQKRPISRKGPLPIFLKRTITPEGANFLKRTMPRPFEDSPLTIAPEGASVLKYEFRKYYVKKLILMNLIQNR